MKVYGFDSENYLLYEKVGGYAFGVSENRTILPLSFQYQDEDGNRVTNGSVGGSIYDIEYVFIEDGFEPTTKIRRGRMLKANPDKPLNWISSPHPLLNLPSGKVSVNGTINHQVFEFQSLNITFIRGFIERSGGLVFLGGSDHRTSWKIVDIESGVFGDTIVYLKARGTFGLLPILDQRAISSDDHRKLIRDNYNQLKDEIFVASPDSVIDRCRELACAAANAYLIEHGYIADNQKVKDLGQLEDQLAKANLKVSAHAAAIVAALHSRTKAVEKLKRGLRPNNEADAQLAISLVSILLVEFKWSYWP